MTCTNFPSAGLVIGVTTHQVGEIIYLWSGVVWEAISVSIGTEDDLSVAYTFKTVALMQASTIVFPVGKNIYWQGYYTESDGGSNWGLVEAGTGINDGGSEFTLADGQHVVANLKGKKISVKKFGAKGDDIQTDDPFINSALATGLSIYAPKGTYKCTDTLNVIGNFSGEGKDTLFKFYGASIARLISKEVTGSLYDFSVDGANVTACPTGIYIEADYEPVREQHSNLTVTNITDAASPTYGILLVRFSDDLAIRGNFYFDKCVVKGITGSAVAKGIIVSFNNESQANMTIRSCNVQDVTPATDGDAIHIVTGAHDDPAADEYQALIENCYVKSSLPMKRAFKVQWHNAKVNNNTVIGDNILIGYDTYSYGCIFDGNTYTSNGVTGEAYNCFNSIGTVISNANIRVNSNAQAMRFSGTSSVKLSNVNIEYQGTAAGDTLGIIQVQDSAEVNAVNLTINSANVAGCGILQSGSGSVSVSNSKLSGMKFGHRCNFGSGSFKMTGQTIISGVEFGVQVFGDNGFIYEVSDSYIEASSIGMYNLSTGNKARTNIRNTELLVGSSGILGTDDDTVTDCLVKNTGAQSGTGVVTGVRGRASNNIIENFTTGLQYNFATNTIINSNTFINCATPIVKTGSVDFVFYENNNR